MKISIIGCGNMGSGIARRLAKEHQLSLIDRTYKRTEALANEIGARPCKSIEEVVAEADVIILAIKPQSLNEIADLKLSEKQLLISLLAGINSKTLKQHFGHAHILRMMPNLPSFYGQGVIGFSDTGELSAEHKQKAEAIATLLGNAFWINENKIDALTSLTASGPAFAFVIIESMIDAAIAMGFTAAEGREYVLQMLTGTLAMLKESGKHPADLKWQVASPGGTTIAGLKKMEEEGVRSGIMNTFIAAFQRAQQLSEERKKV
jgi:pyrroline-5-carboxylate reductase